MSKKEKENSSNNIENVIENTFAHLKDIVDANTVIGKIAKVSDNNYIIPVSKINVGLISGGGTKPIKNNENISACSGTGFNIIPIGFIAIVNNDIKFLPVNTCTDFSKNVIDLLYKVYDKLINTDIVEKGNNDKEK